MSTQKIVLDDQAFSETAIAIELCSYMYWHGSNISCR